VREFIVRRHLKEVLEGAKTPEEKRRLSTALMTGALGLEADQIGMEARDELIRASFRVLDDVPLTKCASRNGAVFVHEAVEVGEKLYGATCAGK
jgi:predicted transcriptional regulator